MKDRHGVEILPTDRVQIIIFGAGARLSDCGLIRPIIRFTRTRVVVDGRDNKERSVDPFCLAVMRRDPEIHEGLHDYKGPHEWNPYPRIDEVLFGVVSD